MDAVDPISPALRARLPELMRSAIAAARGAVAPFGCLLADAESGDVLGVAPNTSSRDATAHAEMNGLRLMAGRGLDPARVVVVSTAEPCPMCASACWWAGVRGVVFGTSIAELIRCGWGQIELPAGEVLERGTPPRSVFLLGGVLAEETDPLYRRGHSGA